MIHERFETRAYCDDGPHEGNMRESSLPLAQFKTWLRRQGWVITRDGKTYCAQHALPSSRRHG